MKTKTQNVPEIRETEYEESETRTVTGIFKEKFMDVLEANRIGDLASTGVKVSVAVSVAAALLDPHNSAELIKQAAAWNGYAIPKSAAGFSAVMYWRAWYSPAKSAAAALVSKFSKKSEQVIEQREVPKILGVPVSEAADFLFEKKAFPRDMFCERFGVSREVHAAIAKRFDSLGVFVRGENNSRVLNPSVGMWYVVAALENPDGLPTVADLGEVDLTSTLERQKALYLEEGEKAVPSPGTHPKAEEN